MKVKVLYNFNDLKEDVKRTVGEEFECDIERAQFLIEKGAVEGAEKLEEINEEEIVKKVFEENKPKKKKNKKKGK